MIGGVVFLVVWLCLFAMGIGGTVLWIWMLIDCAMNEPSSGNDKIVWIIVIALTHWIGALIYFIVRRPVRRERYGR
ncbi:MAG: PLD nuclease N-terminal domain-containing protein [Candidatus Hydrogenedentes bacterium]|nr:PLD nuclease N-terminal domain-containing protein [Candidatus Hydrogenedentota bacterium]